MIYEGGNSKARNPRIQNMLRMIGFGENLGSGFPKIIAAWKETDWGEPELKNKIELDEVELVLPISASKPVNETVNKTEDAARQKDLMSRVCPKLSQAVPSLSQAHLTKAATILFTLIRESSLAITALMDEARETNRSRFRNNILNPLIEAQMVEPTQKDSPQSPKQEYALTAKGIEFLNDSIENN